MIKPKFRFLGQLVPRHLVTIDHERIVKKMFQRKPKRKRRGRPLLRWLEDTKIVVQETKVKRWRHKTMDKELASVFKEAKALRGL